MGGVMLAGVVIDALRGWIALYAGAAGGAVLFYLVVYVLTTLGAFGIVARVRHEDDGGTAIENFAGHKAQADLRVVRYGKQAAE